MSFEDAVQELGDAIEAEAAPVSLEQSQQSTTPEGTSTPDPVQPHHASTQPRDAASGKFIRPDGTLSDTPEPTVEDTFDGGKFNPDTLAPELQPAWKQLQAEFTKKTQELAEQRRQFDGIDPAEARQAVELYQSLQDPNYLVEFHSELSQALQAQGLTPAQANAEAAQITEQAAATPTVGLGDKLDALRQDPDLAPVADEITSMRAELDQFKQAAQMREAQEAARMQQMALAAELQRQEMAIKAANPHYTEEAPDGGVSDMDAIYALSGHTGGDLLAAQQLYESIAQYNVQRWIDQKEAVSTPTDLPSGSSLTSEVPTEINSLDEAAKAAEEALLQSGIDTVGL